MFGLTASALPAAASSVIITMAQLRERGAQINVLKAVEGFFDIVGAASSWRVEVCKELF
jgi:hypothetical protein